MIYDIINCLDASGQILHFVLKLIFKKYAGVSKVKIYFYLPIIFGQLAIIS